VLVHGSESLRIIEMIKNLAQSTAGLCAREIVCCEIICPRDCVRAANLIRGWWFRIELLSLTLKTHHTAALRAQKRNHPREWSWIFKHGIEAQIQVFFLLQTHIHTHTRTHAHTHTHTLQSTGIAMRYDTGIHEFRNRPPSRGSTGFFSNAPCKV
jgi:hypothetical protein